MSFRCCCSTNDTGVLEPKDKDKDTEEKKPQPRAKCAPVRRGRFGHGYGCKKQKVDHRDFKYVPKFAKEHAALSKVDLRSSYKLPACYDQGQLGSCTANAIGFAYHFEEIKQGNKVVIMPSRLFIYYNERALENSVSEDAGASVRDGLSVVNKLGICGEAKTWPYDIAKFAQKPPAAAYAQGTYCKSTAYHAVTQDLAHIKDALSNRLPVVFGMDVYDSFESDAVAKTGLVPMPAAGESVLGGHAIALVGFDDAKKLFVVRNSWGTGWGDHGYFYLPYAYVLRADLCSDFWVISGVMDKAVAVPAK